jgi:acetyl esterase
LSERAPAAINLAAAAAIAARDKGMQMPKSVVSVYPVATISMDTPSKKDEANAKPLNTATGYSTRF